MKLTCVITSVLTALATLFFVAHPAALTLLYFPFGLVVYRWIDLGDKIDRSREPKCDWEPMGMAVCLLIWPLMLIPVGHLALKGIFYDLQVELTGIEFQWPIKFKKDDGNFTLTPKSTDTSDSDK